MGIGENDKKSGAVYVLSVYRPTVGHREQLEKMLSQGPGQGDTSAGNVLLQHLEGGPWTLLDGCPLQFLARLRHERSERRYRYVETRQWLVPVTGTHFLSHGHSSRPNFPVSGNSRSYVPWDS